MWRWAGQYHDVRREHFVRRNNLHLAGAGTSPNRQPTSGSRVGVVEHELHLPARNQRISGMRTDEPSSDNADHDVDSRVILRPSGSFRGRVASPAALLGGDARLSASTDTKNSNHRCSNREHEQEAAEQFHDADATEM
jgi:hypothetical protein